MSKIEALEPLPRRTADLGFFIRKHTKDGGAYRDRTDDLKLAKLALSQLSYGPGIQTTNTRNQTTGFPAAASCSCLSPLPQGQMVGLERLELSTPSLSEKCSNQLSYRPSFGKSLPTLATEE